MFDVNSWTLFGIPASVLRWTVNSSRPVAPQPFSSRAEKRCELARPQLKTTSRTLSACNSREEPFEWKPCFHGAELSIRRSSLRPAVRLRRSSSLYGVHRLQLSACSPAGRAQGNATMCRSAPSSLPECRGSPPWEGCPSRRQRTGWTLRSSGSR